MRTEIADFDGVQGPRMRRLLNYRGALSLDFYRRAHAAFLTTQPGRPTPHISAQALVMSVRQGRWITECPECIAGVTTGRGWSEARCFGCGAIFERVIWPPAEEIPEIERVLLRRPLPAQCFDPGQSIEALKGENRILGVGE